MSMCHREEIECPKCGHKSEFEVWKSINTMLDPEMKAAVLDRSAFKFKCSECGHEANVDYGFLYHQMEDRLMIYYVQDEQGMKDAYEMFRGDMLSDELIEMAQEGYRYRIVTSQNELLEKIIIFDDGYDDRLIEAMKIFIIANLSKDNPELDIQRLYYDDRDKKCFVVIGENGAIGSVDFDEEMYEIVKNDVAKEWPDIVEDDIIINMQWTLERMGIE